MTKSNKNVEEIGPSNGKQFGIFGIIQGME
jgi:hypothetical protein